MEESTQNIAAVNVYARKERPLSEGEIAELRAAALSLFSERVSRKKIAATLNLLPSTIHSWIPTIHRGVKNDGLPEHQPAPEEIEEAVLKAVKIVTQRRCFGSADKKKEFAAGILLGTWRRARKYKPGMKTLTQFCYISAYLAATDYWRYGENHKDALDMETTDKFTKCKKLNPSALECAIEAEEKDKIPTSGTLEFFAARSRLKAQILKARLDELVERGLILRIGEVYRISPKGSRFLDFGRPQVGA